jgi:secondary thiamine-phosphate synthase enzyme
MCAQQAKEGVDMTVKIKQLKLNTKGKTDVIDITGMVNEALVETRISKGMVNVFVIGSTGALTTIEFEPALVADLKEFFERIIPSEKEYAHDRTWGDANGYSHIRASVVGPSVTVPFSEKKLSLGTWQQIVFVDFDNRPRTRTIILTFTGE